MTVSSVEEKSDQEGNGIVQKRKARVVRFQRSSCMAKLSFPNSQDQSFDRPVQKTDTPKEENGQKGQGSKVRDRAPRIHWPRRKSISLEAIRDCDLGHPPPRN